MLQSIKRSLSSPWLRYSLFGVLIASFGVWGIGDVMRGLISPDTEILAEGRGISIDRQSFAVEWQRASAPFRAQGLTSEQLLVGPLPRLVLERMLGQALLQQAAEELHLSVPPAVLKRTIAEEPLFAGEDGRFASWKFTSFLRQANLNEQAYLQALKAQLVQGSLLESMSFSLFLPKPFLRELLASEREQRDIEVLRLPLPPLASVRDPGDEDLRAFMQKEENLFRLPEYRQWAFATLSYETLLKETRRSLDEAQVRAYYEEHRQELSEEERRSLRQLFFVEEDQARQALVQARDGENLGEVAKNFSSNVVFVEKQAQKEFLDEKVATSVFAMTHEGELTVVQGDLGWYLLRLEGIVPTNVPSFDTLRVALTERLLQERAAEHYNKAISEAEDLLLSGASLEATAQTLGLIVNVSPLVDAEKFLADGTKAGRLWKGLSEKEEREIGQELLTLGFSLTSPGEVSQPFEIEGGNPKALFLELREVQEERIADLTEKRPAILAVYRDFSRQETQRARAESLAETMRKQGMRKVARERGLAVQKRSVARNNQKNNQVWEESFLSALFLARKGDVLTTRGAGEEIVVHLVGVRRPTTLSDEEIDKFAKQQAGETPLPLASYQQALQRRAEIRFNEGAFAAFVSTGFSR